MQSMQITELTRELARQEKAGEYLTVIEGVRNALNADPAAFKDPWIKGWVGRRWRDLFMQEAVKDEAAVEYASKPALLASVPLPGFLKNASPRRAIAERFLKDAPASEWQAEMPAAQYASIDNTTLILCGGLLTGLLHSEAHSFPVEAERLYRGARLAHCARRRASDALMRSQ